MGPFLLVLLTLNPQTGEAIESIVVGDPYMSIEACTRAAIARGPVKASAGAAGMLVCRLAGRDYALNGMPREHG